MNKLEKITTRDVDFAQWYTDVVKAAKLVEYLAIKGELVFMPNGWAIWSIIQQELDKRFKKYGIVNVALPKLIRCFKLLNYESLTIINQFFFNKANYSSFLSYITIIIKNYILCIYNLSFVRIKPICNR